MLQIKSCILTVNILCWKKNNIWSVFENFGLANVLQRPQVARIRNRDVIETMVVREFLTLLLAEVMNWMNHCTLTPSFSAAYSFWLCCLVDNQTRSCRMFSMYLFIHLFSIHCLFLLMLQGPGRLVPISSGHWEGGRVQGASPSQGNTDTN